MHTIFFSALIISLQMLASCQPSPVSSVENSPILKTNLTEGHRLFERFQPPAGFERQSLPTISFGYFLRNLPLKPANSQVHLFDGRLKSNQSAHAAVVNMDTGDSDLQQCADAVMRLRAEYLFDQKQYDKIQFNLTNGFKMDYAKWRRGYRVKVDGNKTEWYATKSPSTSYESFRDYLDIVFMYAGTLSLTRELRAKQVKDLEVGDVFIQGGSPGHAVLVVDVAEKEWTGEKVFLLAQSYMPAQEIHVLKNPINDVLSPWFSADFGEKLVTPEWTFKRDMLKSFE